jgi:hypothetical protein
LRLEESHSTIFYHPTISEQHNNPPSDQILTLDDGITFIPSKPHELFSSCLLHDDSKDRFNQDATPSEPAGIGSCWIALDDDGVLDLNDGITVIPSKPPGGLLGSRLSFDHDNDCLNQDATPSEPVGVGSRLIALDDDNGVLDVDNGITVIPSKPPDLLGSRLLYDDVCCFHQDATPSEPAGIGSCWIALADNCVPNLDNGIIVIPSKLPELLGSCLLYDDNNDRFNHDPTPNEPTGTGSHLPHSADNVFENNDGITDSIPSEPPGLSSCLPVLVTDLFGVGDDNGIYLVTIPSEPPAGLVSLLFSNDEDDLFGLSKVKGIILSCFRASLLDLPVVSLLSLRIVPSPSSASMIIVTSVPLLTMRF